MRNYLILLILTLAALVPPKDSPNFGESLGVAYASGFQQTFMPGIVEEIDAIFYPKRMVRMLMAEHGLDRGSVAVDDQPAFIVFAYDVGLSGEIQDEIKIVNSDKVVRLLRNSSPNQIVLAAAGKAHRLGANSYDFITSKKGETTIRVAGKATSVALAVKDDATVLTKDGYIIRVKRMPS